MENHKNNFSSKKSTRKAPFRKGTDPKKPKKVSLNDITKNEYNTLIISLNSMGFKRDLQKEVGSGQKSSKKEIKRIFSRDESCFQFSYFPEKNKLRGTLKSPEPKGKFLKEILDQKE